jgi:hypothetical protein
MFTSWWLTSVGLSHDSRCGAVYFQLICLHTVTRDQQEQASLSQLRLHDSIIALRTTTADLLHITYN